MFRVLDSLEVVLTHDKNNHDALAFYVHIYADRFCPMHVAHLDDKGGNAVKMKWFGQNTNLHSVWDAKIIDSKGFTYSEYAAYLAGKIRLNEQGFKDIKKAIKLFEISAKNGNSYAEYQLGKLYVFGKEIVKDYDKGMEYLKSSAEQGNSYAEQLIHSIENNRDWSASIGIINLLYHLSRTLRNKTEDNKDNYRGIDRKLKRKIDEKKQAQGLRL